MTGKRFVSLLLFISFTPFIAAQSLSVRGADSMLMLGQRFSDRLNVIFPVAHLSVNGGGVSAAAVGMGEGHVDVLQSSRRLTSSELQSISHSVLEFPVGIESVVFYVNDANPIRQLTTSQLRDFYTGKITNWKSVGGPDLAVSLVSLEAFVGGSPFVKEVLLGGEDVDTTARGYTNPKEMAQHVTREKGAIGFGPLMTMNGIHAIALKKGVNFPASVPTSATLRSMDYPLSRYLYWTVRAPMSANLHKISDWVLSSEGQLIVESLGYYPLDAADRSRATGSLAGSK